MNNGRYENANHYEQGLKLAEAGQYQQALACMQEHLRTAGDDAQVLNDTGAILHCLGRSVEAIDYHPKTLRELVTPKLFENLARE